LEKRKTITLTRKEVELLLSRKDCDGKYLESYCEDHKCGNRFVCKKLTEFINE
jgi:hypothetical protein